MHLAAVRTKTNAVVIGRWKTLCSSSRTLSTSTSLKSPRIAARPSCTRTAASRPLLAPSSSSSSSSSSTTPASFVIRPSSVTHQQPQQLSQFHSISRTTSNTTTTTRHRPRLAQTSVPPPFLVLGSRYCSAHARAKRRENMTDRDILPDNFKPTHYDLEIRDLDFTSWSYKGTVRYASPFNLAKSRVWRNSI